MSETSPNRKLHSEHTSKKTLHPSEINPSYTIRVSCCVLFIFLTEICLAHYVYRLINSEIRAEYVAKNEFRNYLVNELRSGSADREILDILKTFHQTQETPESKHSVTRKKRGIGSFDYNTVNQAGDEPHVEFFPPGMRSDLENRDETIRKQTGNKGAAPGGDSWVWLTSYSRIPERALEGYCKKIQKFCPEHPGPVGPPGLPGAHGPTGLPGLPGITGPRGFPGPKGEKGDRGLPGLDGINGIPGEPGLDGLPGRNGRDGIDGEKGESGKDGRNGIDGRPGAQGPPGAVGPTGPRGLTGPRGKAGRPGINGTPGIPGINAWKHHNDSKLLIPPSIANAQSTPIGVVARETENVRLHCGANGVPEPRVTWRRLDNRTISMGSWEDVAVTGNTISIPKVHRDHMGLYVCAANNGVPPQVNQTFNLEVYFPPRIRIRNQVVGVAAGSNVVLECEVEAYPEPVRYWERADGRLIEDGSKYKIENSYMKYGYITIMRLTIKRVIADDFAEYHCISKNELLATRGKILLREIDPRFEIPTLTSDEEGTAEYGPSPPEKKAMGDICPPPLVCPKCDSAMKCNMDSVFLFDLIKRWEVREYNSGERYNGTVPRTVDCLLYAVGKPVYNRYTDQINGCWMRDSDPRTHKDSEKYWVTSDKPEDSHKLFEFEDKTTFRKNVASKTYSLDYAFQGNAHVVYNGSFFYNQKGTRKIIKMDLATGSRSELSIPLPRGMKEDAILKPLYKTAYNHMDFCVDDNGLWVIFAVPGCNNTGIMKIDANQVMVPQQIWNISLDHHKVGEMFIVCGVLYAVDSVTERNTSIRFAFDLYKNTLLDVNLPFTNPFRKTTMIEYNQKHKELYTWDKGNQLTYPVRYHEIGYNYTSKEDQSAEKLPSAEKFLGAHAEIYEEEGNT